MNDEDLKLIDVQSAQMDMRILQEMWDSIPTTPPPPPPYRDPAARRIYMREYMKKRRRIHREYEVEYLKNSMLAPCPCQSCRAIRKKEALEALKANTVNSVKQALRNLVMKGK